MCVPFLYVLAARSAAPCRTKKRDEGIYFVMWSRSCTAMRQSNTAYLDAAWSSVKNRNKIVINENSYHFKSSLFPLWKWLWKWSEKWIFDIEVFCWLDEESEWVKIVRKVLRGNIYPKRRETWVSSTLYVSLGRRNDVPRSVSDALIFVYPPLSSRRRLHGSLLPVNTPLGEGCFVI